MQITPISNTNTAASPTLLFYRLHYVHILRSCLCLLRQVLRLKRKLSDRLVLENLCFINSLTLFFETLSSWMSLRYVDKIFNICKIWYAWRQPMVRDSVQATGSQHSRIRMIFENRMHLLKASFQDLRPNLTESSNFETEVLYLSK
jgi:hypothetical protein